MIEFEEFLSIIKNSDGDEKSQKIYKFFKDMTSGTLKNSNDLPFTLLVQKLRRGYMLDAIMAGENDKKDLGMRILKNVGKLI